MSEPGDTQYCPNCGQEAGAEDRFCRSCGYNLSVPPPGEGRIETGQVNVPPPPTPTPTPAQDGLGGFLRSFGMGAGIFIGCVTALFLLFVGCAVIGGLAGAGG